MAKTYSIVSNSTNDDYLSTSNLDSSDLEFYDISDHESDTIEEGDHSFESVGSFILILFIVSLNVYFRL